MQYNFIEQIYSYENQFCIKHSYLNSKYVLNLLMNTFFATHPSIEGQLSHYRLRG